MVCHSQVESGVLDGVYIVEPTIPRKKMCPSGLIYIEELEDTITKIEWMALTADSLELVYTHSTYGVITKQSQSMIGVDDPIVTNLLLEGQMFCSHRFLYSLVLANFMDRIQLYHEGELVFSVSYYNFNRDACYREYSVLLDELLTKMVECRRSAKRLEEPIYPNFNID
jgi:hypothetical protein